MKNTIFGRKHDSLTDDAYRTILGASPDYVATLLKTGFITLEVYSGDDAPAIAWTYWGERDHVWHVSFHAEAATLSPDALTHLWRHEIGHISLAHFAQETCNPDDPIRSHVEQLQVGDIQINTYLLDRAELMEEIGAKVIEMASEEEREVITDKGGKGFIDPRVALPDIGLAVQPYSYDIIHTFLHNKMDEEAESNGRDPNWTQQIMKGMCGGIHGPEQPNGMAEATAAVVAGVAGDSGNEMGGEKWGSEASLGTIRLPESDLPPWINPLETFARSIVEVVLADKRSHTKPQPIYQAYDVHMPTQQPRWAYQPAVVVFCVDTSGSMIHELKYVSPVISYLAQHNIKTRLIAGDIRVTFDELVDKVPEGLVGGGGTDIVPILDRALGYEPESMVVFTDGWVPSWGKDPEIPVLWVGVHETPPYGTGVNAEGQYVSKG